MPRLRNIKNSYELLLKDISFINDPKKYKGKWNKEIFKNANPISIEIGCGKGKFICELAKNNLNKNYIAIDKSSSILVKLLKKIKLEKLNNIKVILLDAKELGDVFRKKEVNNIYLNFSDPWPKKRHQKRRLTHINYLNIYKKIASRNSKIEFKTDNLNLFKFTLNTLNENGFIIVDKTFDLINYDELNKNNIKTEYEIKFIKRDFKINKVIFYINKNYLFHKIRKKDSNYEI